MALEEAGAETVATVIATVKPASQNEFRTEVDELAQLSLLETASQYDWSIIAAKFADVLRSAIIR